MSDDIREVFPTQLTEAKGPRRASKFPEAPSLTSILKSSSCLKSLTLRGMQGLLAIGVRTPCSEKCRPRNGESSFKSTSITTLHNLRPSVVFNGTQGKPEEYERNVQSSSGDQTRRIRGRTETPR